MTKLLLPLPEIKRYVKALKKHPRNTLNHTQLTDIVAKALGYQNLRDLKDSTSSQTSYQSASGLSLFKLEQWKQDFYEELSRHGVNPECDHCIFDKYIQAQIDGIRSLPALRISGLLYLIGYMTGKSFFSTQDMNLNSGAMLDCLRSKKLPECLKYRLAEYSEKNRLEQSRYHEGVFSNLVGMWTQGSLSNVEFACEVEALIAEEIEYLNQVMARGREETKKATFSFPAARYDSDKPTNTDFMQQVRNAVHLNAPLLMGAKRQKMSSLSLFDSKYRDQNLLLTNPQIKENILLAGCAGSGKTRIGISFVSQAIMSGSGCFYMDGANSIISYSLIASMAKSVGRQDDVIYWSFDDKSFLLEDLGRLIAANKIVVLCIPCIEKDPESILPHFKKFVMTLWSTLKGIEKRQMSQYFPYLIVLSDLICLFARLEPKYLSELVRAANKANIAVALMDQDLVRIEDLIGKNGDLFKHGLVMKQEDPPERFFSTTRRDSLNLGPGEFLYHKRSNAQPQESVYMGPFSDPEVTDVYLVMS